MTHEFMCRRPRGLHNCRAESAGGEGRITEVVGRLHLNSNRVPMAADRGFTETKRACR